MLKLVYRILFFLCVLPVLSWAQITLVKGPYLQTGTANSMIVKWQTNILTDTKIAYGTNPSSLTSFSTSAALDTIHEVKLIGLNPYTKYFYAIGTTTGTIQGDTNNYFITSPLPASTGKFRFWVTGDCGNNSSNQDSVRNAYLSFNGNKHTDGWLLLGDNAYTNGTDQEYNVGFFAHYQGNIMKKTVLWPATGNHDYANTLALQNSHAIAYYDIFSLPKMAEAGGIASGTEAFYSYDYGNIHFIALDSYGHEANMYRLYDTIGPQVIWLKQDLAANTKKWTAVYFHHPPYTMTSHNSDTEGELDSIRKNLVRILERYKVDLVMCGHSHGYERSKLMKGHYGYESSFNSATHHLSSSSAKYDNTPNSCPYIKDPAKASGIVHVVSGSAGSLGGQQLSFPHDAMYYSNATNGGSFILDVNKNRLDGSWLCADGVIRDHFTVFKDVNNVYTYTLTAGQNFTLNASWPGNYYWSTPSMGDTLNALSIAPTSDSVFWVSDKANCIADTFHIKAVLSVVEQNGAESFVKVIPNPCKENCRIKFYLDVVSDIEISLIDILGKESRLYANKKYDKGLLEFELNTRSMVAGMYLVKIKINGRDYYYKFVMDQN
jgi:hypothetical protein